MLYFHILNQHYLFQVYFSAHNQFYILVMCKNLTYTLFYPLIIREAFFLPSLKRLKAKIPIINAHLINTTKIKDKFNSKLIEFINFTLYKNLIDNIGKTISKDINELCNGRGTMACSFAGILHFMLVIFLRLKAKNHLFPLIQLNLLNYFLIKLQMEQSLKSEQNIKQ